jgi:hypothetical protein
MKFGDLEVRAVKAPGQLPVTPEYIEEVQTASGASLPPDYTAFILAAGRTCRPINRRLFNAEGHDGSVVSLFFGSDHEGTYDLLSNLVGYRGRIPSTLLPIGCDPGGNMVCLGIAPPDSGKVFFWDHENENMAGPPWRENVHKIADSFTEFMDKLKAEDDE